MADAWLGRTLSHYEIVEKLGEGGMGVVYKARDTHLERFVAIKVLPPEKLWDAERTRRFVREAKAASALNHPNIITIHDIAEERSITFMVMEYVTGKTLDRTIHRQGMRLNEALKYAVQVADALSAAHEAGIIHRDLKPSNVMVTEKGQVKVLDFGLAKLTEKADPIEAATQTLQQAGSLLTDEGALLGTAAYMSPEQTEAKKVDARSDIFSFGSMLYEMVTGRRAFQGDSRMSTLTAILRDEPKPASDGVEAVPRDLQKIIARCLRKDPSRRFQTMADLKVALEEVKEESESGRLTELPAAAPARGRALFAYAAVALIVLAAATTFWWRSRVPAAGTTNRGLSLRQLTQDTGRTTDPAISPDGKLVAYASDRAGDAGMDIWVQQLTAGAQPIRLTRNKADDLEPSFSPDGGRIVFSSGRNGGGIYVMPALGGEERLLLRGLYFRPRFSPDGQWIAASAPSTFNSTIAVIPVSGGAPHLIAQDFSIASSPVRSPDGTRILFVGLRQQSEQRDWWVSPLDGGPVVKAGADAILKKFGLGEFSSIQEWLDGQVLVSAGNLWRIPFSGDYKVGTPERLTTSTVLERSARAISGPKGWRIVFASSQESQSLWSLPLDLNAAKVLGQPTKLFQDALQRTTPSLSTDGTRLVYVSRGLEGYEVRLRNTKTGTETTLAQTANDMRARISPDGATVAYNPSNTEAEKIIFLVAATGGDARKFCDTCGLIYDWAPDGKKIAYRTGNPMRFWAIEVATNRQTEIVAHPKYGIYVAVPSPDQHWMAVTYGGPGAPQGLFIAPVGENGVAKPQDEWITVAERPGPGSRAWWSPNGNVIYYLLNAERQFNIAARRVDPRTKQPRGRRSSFIRRRRSAVWFSATYSVLRRAPGSSSSRSPKTRATSGSRSNDDARFHVAIRDIVHIAPDCAFRPDAATVSERCPLTGHIGSFPPPSVWFDRPHPNTGVLPPITPCAVGTVRFLNARRPGRIYCSDTVGTAGRSKVRDASLTAKCRLPVQRCGVRRHVSQQAAGVLLIDGQDVGLNEGLKVLHLAWGDAVPGRRNNGRRALPEFLAQSRDATQQSRS